MKFKLIWNSIKKKEKFNSQNYWENRYNYSGNSGPGSYGRLAEFKARFLNDFVNSNNIQRVLELGCGDGNQLSLSHYPQYIGVDVSKKAIEICKHKFSKDLTKSFLNWREFKKKSISSDLVISLDVIYHLIEDKVYHEYMIELFNSSIKYVIIYSSNHEERIAQHVKCRRFSDWIEKNLEKEFELISCIENLFPFDPNDPNNTSHSDFYIYQRISKSKC